MEFVTGILVGGLIMTATMMISMAKAAKMADECETQIISKEHDPRK